MMKFFHCPNVPDSKAGLVLVDGRISGRLQQGFESRQIEVVKTERYPGLYEAISYHPDIMLHHLGDGDIVYAPGIDSCVLNRLRSRGFRLIEGATRLEPSYPGDIAYNVARVGNIAFHNTRYTDPILFGELAKRGVSFVHVKQGYTKCSTCIVNKDSIITSDEGISKAAERNGICALLIGEQTHIRLPGLGYGFIGGCTGLISESELAFSGDIERLEAKSLIRRFLDARDVKSINLAQSDVEDIGSIIPLKVFESPT